MSESSDFSRDFQFVLQRQQAERARSLANGPKKMADVVGRLMMRRGYGRLRSADQLVQVWQQVAGEDVSRSTRVGTLRRGTLEIIVTDSVLLSELLFFREEFLAQLQGLLPERKIRALKFRSGSL